MNPRINTLLMFVYSADGQKLRTVHYTAAPNISVAAGQTHELSKDEILSVDSTDYIGSLVVRNGKPDMYTFTGGYYAFAGTYPSLGTVGGLYFYNYDHLGNVREVVNEDGKLLQVTNYYPFGAPYSDNRITSMNPKLQPYKYTGKELDLVHGLNTYDHGARQNYSALGVWDRVDPLAEKYYNMSPYAVCGDNPINIIDINGYEGVKYIDNNSNKHIDVNVVVLLQPKIQIPLGASEKEIKKINKENRKIERRNNEIEEKITTSLNNKFNAKNVKNSAGEKVYFEFNIIAEENENYKTTSSVSVQDIATKYGLKAKTPDRFVGSFGYGIALPIVFSQGSAGSSEGVTVNPLVRVNSSTIPFEDVLGHEAAHTFGLQDDYLGSGIMASPPQELSPSDIDKIWNNAYER